MINLCRKKMIIPFLSMTYQWTMWRNVLCFHGFTINYPGNSLSNNSFFQTLSSFMFIVGLKRIIGCLKGIGSKQLFNDLVSDISYVTNVIHSSRRRFWQNLTTCKLILFYHIHLQLSFFFLDFYRIMTISCYIPIEPPFLWNNCNYFCLIA